MNEVSIIIVSFQCSKVIEALLDSLKTYASGAEVIIVDNHSTDGTTVILSRFENDFNIYYNNENLGFTKAVNQGIDVATNKYIFLLNPDTYLSDLSLNKLVSTLKQNPDIGAVVPNLYYPSNEIQNYIRRFPDLTGVLVEHFIPAGMWNRFGAYRRYTCQDLDLNRFQPVEQPAGAAILFERGFRLDEAYFIYGSDVELCKQIWDSGKKIILDPETKVFHHQSQGGTSTGNLKLKMFLQLDALYGYGLYFQRYKSYGYYLLYRFSVGGILGLIALSSVVKGREAMGIKWNRFLGFIRKENFRQFIYSNK